MAGLLDNGGGIGNGEGLDASLACRVDELKEILHGITLFSDREDKWVWGIDRAKQVTVKSCTKSITPTG